MHIKEILKADFAVCENADSFLQSSMWGEFKSRFGWKSHAFLIEWDTGEKFPLLVISRCLVLGFSFAYVPWGPQLPANLQGSDRTWELARLAKKLKPFFARNTTFIRFDPPWYVESETAVLSISEETNIALAKAELIFAGFERAAAVVQPPDTVIINLDASCEDILAGMKPKWRYNISLAGKKGVQVNTGGELETFYALLKETAARDGIAVHSFDYYKTLFEICAAPGAGQTLRLYTAVHEGDTLAAIVVLFRGKTATYLYGASSNIKRNLMAPYALQWRAMQDAKEAGCHEYDLFGIPPNDDPNHPMAGLYRFKTGFGGRLIHRPGSWDYPYKRAVYALFNMAEGFRKKLRDRKKKK